MATEIISDPVIQNEFEVLEAMRAHFAAFAALDLQAIFANFVEGVSDEV